MSLNRIQLLDEMGLSPQWKLREQPSVRRGAKKLSTTMAPPLVDAVPDVGREQVTTMAAGAERTEKIGQMSWNLLRESIVSCRACGLCAERKQAVPGVGDQNADWLLVGEGPGAEEDNIGEPFVGPAGKLLDAMLAAIDLKRNEGVYITNAVKCRPPGNRNPEASEIAACLPYLKRQIALIQPKLIVLLGRAAAHAALGEETTLASLRGKPLAYPDGEQTIPVIVTYHPAYLLRTLPDKSKAWEDLCRARTLMHALNVV